METTTTKQTTTYPVSTDPSDPITETVELKTGNQPGKGNVEDRTTTTEYGNGTKITETYLTEGTTQKLATSKETIKTDGSSEKETYSTENVDDFTNTKVPYAINKTSVKKDKDGNITEDVQINIEAQASDGSYPVKETKTTTNYSGSTKTDSVVETKYQNGQNSGFFKKEIKDKSGNTTSKEMEYYFDGSSYYYASKENGSLDRDTYIDHKTVKIIFKDDGTNKYYKITQGAGDIPQATFHHKVMSGGWSYVTVLKVESDKITIVSLGGHEESKEDPQNPGDFLYPVEGGSTINDVYTLNNSLTLSFSSKF